MNTKRIPILIIAALLMSGCDTSISAASGDLEILGEACKTLANADKRKLCLSALERIRGESKSTPQATKHAGLQATRELITFKDVPLGKAGVKAALRDICRLDKSNKRETWDNTEPCVFQGNRNVIWLSYGNLDHSLARIELGEGESLELVEIKESKGAMLGLVEILQEKYGAPRKTTNSVENKMGTKFDQDIFVWVDAQGNRIVVESIYDKIDHGRVIIESSARVAARGVAEKLLKEVSKSNL